MDAAVADLQASRLPHLGLTVRLEANFINCLAAVLPDDASSEEIEGLLFGKSDAGQAVLKTFQLSNGSSDLSRQANFEDQVPASRNNAQMAGYSLLGWFSVRSGESLRADDICFHERNFPNADDLGLIVNRDFENEISFVFYGRSADGALTLADHRVGTVRISMAEPQSSAVEVGMVAGGAAEYQQVRQIAPPVASAGVAKQRARDSDDVSEGRRRRPQIGSRAVLAVIAVGVSSGVFFMRNPGSRRSLAEPAHERLKAQWLNLKVTATGNQFQLSWDRDAAAVRNAREATLNIGDGAVRHRIVLDRSELENGSVLYLPESDDVVFRLELRGAAGQQTTETLRVVGTAKPRGLEVSHPKSTLSGVAVSRAGTLIANRAEVGAVRDQGAHPVAPAERGQLYGKPEHATIAYTADPSIELQRVSGQNSLDHKLPGSETGADAAQAGTAAADAAAGKPTEAPIELMSAAQTAAAKISLPLRLSEASSTEPTGSADPAAATPAATARPAQQPSLDYKPPRSLKQVMPNLGTLRSGLADNIREVKVVVKVDRLGQVTDARVAEGGDKIGPIAWSALLTSARQWKFEPATLHGQRITSEHTIVFRFPH